MISVSSLIEFLLSLLRDDDVLAEFEADPDGVLARNGLDGVTAQDIRDARPLLADRDGVTGCDDDEVSFARHGSRRDDHDDDPVRAVHQVTREYRVEHREHHSREVEVRYVDNSSTTHVDRSVSIDKSSYVDNSVTNNVYNDHRTYIDNSVDNSVNGDGNTVITDSYNQDNDSVVIEGDVTDSIVSGDSTVGSTNDADDTTTTVVVEDSFDDVEIEQDVEVEIEAETLNVYSAAVPEPDETDDASYADPGSYSSEAASADSGGDGGGEESPSAAA